MPFTSNLDEIRRLCESRGGLYHRGWIFTEPFHCLSCGREITYEQFNFARACGSCDTGRNAMRRIIGGPPANFAGPHQLVNPNDEAFINPKWYPPPPPPQQPPVISGLDKALNDALDAVHALYVARKDFYRKTFYRDNK